MFGVGGDLWRSSSPTSPLKQVHLEHFDVNPLSRWRVKKKWKYIHRYSFNFFSLKERSSVSLFDNNCNSKTGTLGNWHRRTGQSTPMARLLPSAVSCLRQLVTLSVPRAVLENIQIPRARLQKRSVFPEQLSGFLSALLCSALVCCGFFFFFCLLPNLLDSFLKSELADVEMTKKEGLIGRLTLSSGKPPLRSLLGVTQSTIIFLGSLDAKLNFTRWFSGLSQKVKD